MKCCFTLLFLLPLFLQAQEIRQTVKGSVADKLTGEGLEGADVHITAVTDSTLLRTDAEGRFTGTVSTGRYQLRVTFTGYATITQELLVIAGHETVLTLELTPNTTLLETVTVTGDQDNNDVAGLRTLSIEKTLRVPANFLDPVRAVTTYPGVVTANDQGNAMIVHGNSPNGLLWRLNGLDIVNPNHLSNAGTFSDKPAANGGGVNILSAQMLGHTSFYLGALPINYGNALAGVVDMRLREGNIQQYEYTAQASLIGMDVAAEGPVNSKHNSSFLANYRYSTVGLLSAMGVDFGDEAITFQDFSFNLAFHQKNGGKAMVFGLGGLSRNDFDAKETADLEEFKDLFDIRYKAYTYALGTTYEVPLANGARFSGGLSYSATQQERTQQRPVEPTLEYHENYFYRRGQLSGFARYTKRIGEQTLLDVGINVSSLSDSLMNDRSYPLLEPFCVACTDSLSGKVSGFLYQPYFSLRMAWSATSGMVAGARYVGFTYGRGSGVAEPRVSIYYNPSVSTSFDLAYAMVNQLQMTGTYLAAGNANLGFTKSHQVTLNYTQRLRRAKFYATAYYQKLVDVPVSLSDSSFSTINLMENVAPAYLVPDGTGQNYGLDLLLERSFYGHHYFTAGASLYNSTYSTINNATYNTRFNGRYTLSGMYGREWTKPSRNRTMGASLRALYLGGLRESAIDPAASERAFQTRYYERNPYAVKLNDYFRIDLRVSFRKNKPGYTRTLSFDLQNVLNTQNEAYHYYDNYKREVTTKYQLGIIPMVVYRIDF